jgi:hypothetical protein
MEVDDIISYHDLVTAEKASLQKGMNYRVGKDYSVFLMSLRENAPYADALDQVTGMLTYEGHDEPQRQGGPNPKEIDQPETTSTCSAVPRRADDGGHALRSALHQPQQIALKHCQVVEQIKIAKKP